MPEGPSIVILKEAVQSFTGKKIIAVEGNSKMDIQRLEGEKIMDFKSWGKHFLICLKTFSVRIHFMLFGTYRINERKESTARLSLQFKDGEINFYACSVQFIEEPLDEVYDWTEDVMNYLYNEEKAVEKLMTQPNLLACDALLDQHIFSGSGNIIKNEVLFRVRVHPLSVTAAMPLAKLEEMVREVVVYSFEFLEWKKAYVLKKHWLAHTKTMCVRDDVPLEKKYLGKTKRRSFYCNNCQHLYE